MADPRYNDFNDILAAQLAHPRHQDFNFNDTLAAQLADPRYQDFTATSTAQWQALGARFNYLSQLNCCQALKMLWTQSQMKLIQFVDIPSSRSRI